MLFLAPVCVIFMITLQVTCRETPFTDSDLRFVVKVHDAFCTDTLRCGNIVVNETPANLSARLGVVPPSSDEVCCGECSCDKQVCRIVGQCCPDAIDHLPTVKDSKDKQQIFCEYLQMKPYKPFEIAYAENAYVVFHKCPDSSMHPDIISKCEQSNLYEDLDTQVPVTDTLKMQIFRNRYCAYCYGADEADLVYWDTSVSCLRDIYIPSDIDHVVRDVIELSDCNIISYSPKELLTDMRQLTCDKPIEICNATGHWAQYDPVIEAACHAYGFSHPIYKNIYCYLCNTDDRKASLDCWPPHGDIPFITFSALLKFTPIADSVEPEERPNSKHTCSANQLYDSFKNVCRNISCLAPKTFRNGSCYNTIDYLGGVDYKVFLKMTPTQDLSYNDLIGTVDDLDSYMFQRFDRMKVHGMQKEFDIYNKMNQSSVEYFVIYFKLFSSTIHPIYLSAIDEILAMDGSTHIIERRHGGTLGFLTELEVYDFHMSFRMGLLVGESDVTLRSMPTDMPLFYENRNASLEILLTQLAACPLTAIEISEYTLQIQTWGITIYELKTHLKRNEYILIGENDTLLICVDKYLRILSSVENPQMTTSVLPDTISHQLSVGVVSLVCTAVSVVSALLTLLTYSLFKELRTQPGINNMCLIVSLVTAQVLFLFSSSQANHISKLSCQIIGILIHFSWLMVVFWTNVCSYHMYTVFNSKVVANTAETLSTLKYVLYCSTLSVILVSINIIVVILDSNGNDIGYSGSSCYISRSTMVGYVFALPVGLVILSNLVMFVIVIVTLARTPNIEKHSERNRNLFVIYAKISTLTGIAWLFGFVYHFSGIVAFEYMFIILNAGQGVFVFLSFVCNRRVARLYMALKSSSHTEIAGNLEGQTINNQDSNKDTSTNDVVECAT